MFHKCEVKSCIENLDVHIDLAWLRFITHTTETQITRNKLNFKIQLFNSARQYFNDKNRINYSKTWNTCSGERAIRESRLVCFFSRRFVALQCNNIIINWRFKTLNKTV